MQSQSSHVIQIIFSLLFLGVLGIGGYVLANFNRFSGPDPEIPSENSSSRTYTRVQFVLVWLHALGLSGAFALLLH